VKIKAKRHVERDGNRHATGNIRRNVEEREHRDEKEWEV
jgi:hypothetical protein